MITSLLVTRQSFRRLHRYHRDRQSMKLPRMANTLNSLSRSSSLFLMKANEGPGPIPNRCRAVVAGIIVEAEGKKDEKRASVDLPLLPLEDASYAAGRSRTRQSCAQVQQATAGANIGTTTQTRADITSIRDAQKADSETPRPFCRATTTARL